MQGISLLLSKYKNLAYVTPITNGLQMVRNGRGLSAGRSEKGCLWWPVFHLCIQFYA